MITGVFQIHVTDTLVRYMRKTSSRFNLITDRDIWMEDNFALDIEDMNY